MTIDEIKAKIKLDSPTGPVSYMHDFRQRQLCNRVENFEKEWRKRMYLPEHVEQFVWEFGNRQLGQTTEMLIEALQQMSDGKIVRIVTYNEAMQQNVQHNLRKYCKQLGIKMLYAGKNESADWVRTDHAGRDLEWFRVKQWEAHGKRA